MNTKTKTPKTKVIRTSETSVTLTEGVSGKKMVSELNKEKFQLNKDFKADIGGIFSVRKRVCKLGQNYINQLNAKFGTSLTPESILLTDVNQFTWFMTDKEKEQCKKRAENLGKDPETCPQFTGWLFIQLLGRFAKCLKIAHEQKTKVKS
jgi:hypothetical protein